MYRGSPFHSTLNTGYIKLWTCVALDQCKSWTPFGHFCPYFHTPYTLLCPKDEFTFTFRRGLIWKIDNPSTTLSLAPGIFDNPYKGAESAGCHKHQLNMCLVVKNVGFWVQPHYRISNVDKFTWHGTNEFWYHYQQNIFPRSSSPKNISLHWLVLKVPRFTIWSESM